MNVERLDHIVLTVADIERTLHFYRDVLGMQAQTFAGGRKALRFGDQKLNLHQQGAAIPPIPLRPTPGSADLCFITLEPVERVAEHLRRQQVEVVEGPVEKTGARSLLRSIYFFDPDGNLIEVSNEVD